MKTSAGSDLTVDGSTLAAHAFNAGPVDECQLFIYPVLVGEGKPAFPSDARVQLELLEEHRFGNGVMNLRYRIQSLPSSRKRTGRLRFDDPNWGRVFGDEHRCWKRRT
jgi:dihydrofolate reductase